MSLLSALFGRVPSPQDQSDKDPDTVSRLRKHRDAQTIAIQHMATENADLAYKLQATREEANYLWEALYRIAQPNKFLTEQVQGKKETKMDMPQEFQDHPNSVQGSSNQPPKELITYTFASGHSVRVNGTQYGLIVALAREPETSQHVEHYFKIAYPDVQLEPSRFGSLSKGNPALGLINASAAKSDSIVGYSEYSNPPQSAADGVLIMPTRESNSGVNYERDPNGKDAHEKGAKLDAGKQRPHLVLGGFSRALSEVVRVGSYGAEKYTDDGWKSVPNGVSRYQEASARHGLEVMFAGIMSINHKDGGVYHQAQKIWNDLAALELALKDQEDIKKASQS